MRKKGMLLIILLMAVGFAAVSTTLFINGNTDIIANQDDFNVYFSDVYINGNQDKSVIKSDRVIEFNTEFSKVGQEYILDYEVTNGSKNYDAELVMNCVSSSEYLSVTNDFDDDTILSSMDYRIGRLVVEQTKSYVGEELEVTIKCTIDANASERTSLGIFKEKEIEVEAIDANDSLVDASAYQISGEAKDNLYDLLVESNNIDDSVSVRSFIQLDSENINDISKATFYMSPVATTGDNIIILNFNKITSDWELVSLNKADSNKEVIVDFSDIEVIPFATQNDDGSLEIKLSTVTFNGNGGTSNESIRSLIYNQAIGELPTATRTGYEFNGWYTKTSDGEKVDSNYKVKGNITLYALWNVNNYNVSVTNNGNGTVGVTSVAVPYGGTKTFTVTPNSGYYLSSISCTNGYTVSGFTTGITHLSTQTVTVSNNNNDSDSVCNVSFTKLPTPTATGGSNSWKSSNVTVSLTNKPTLVGNATYEYYVTTSTTAPTASTAATGTTTNSVTISDNGTRYVYFRLKANDNSKSDWSSAQKVMLDKTVPTITLNSSVPASVTKGDSYALISSYTTSSISGGTVSCSSNLNGTLSSNNTSVLTSVGTHTITCTSKTGAGKTASASKTVKITYTAYTAVNLITNSGFDVNSGWVYRGNYNLANSILTFNGTATGWESFFGTNYLVAYEGNSNHKYYVMTRMKNTSSSWSVGFGAVSGGGGVLIDSILENTGGIYKEVSAMITPQTISSSGGYFGFYKRTTTSASEYLYVDYVTVINLTATFGAGNEPSKSWCDQHIDYFSGTSTIYK